MTPSAARLSLVLLWLGFVARVLGENVLRYYVLVRVLLPFVDPTAEASFHPAVLPLLILVAVSVTGSLLFAPLVGRLARPDAARAVMVAATLVAALGALLGGAVTGSWVGALGLVAATTPFFAAARGVSVKRLSLAADFPLPAAQATFTALGVLGTLGGWWLGAVYDAELPYRLPAAAAIAAACFLVSALFLVWARVPPDGDPAVAPEAAHVRVRFWPALGRVLADFDARLALCANTVLMLVSLCLLVLVVTQRPDADLSLGEVAGLGAFALGALLAATQTHPHRVRLWVPIGFGGMLAFTVHALANDRWTHPGLWFCAGLTYLPLRSAFVLSLRPGTRGVGLAALYAVPALGVLLFLAGLGFGPGGTPAPQGAAIDAVTEARAAHLAQTRAELAWTAFGILAVSTFVFGAFYSRALVETIVELILKPMYRIRVTGPGLRSMPFNGPMLILANHACWFDPFWLTSAVPTRITPMMTASFWDLPVVSYLMRRVIQGIRVPESPLRRTAPELAEAIAALDRGESVVLFPEGYLRRTEARELRRFGQGVWQILKARPDTPVFLCWVEGGWGSYTSFKDGPPTKNKKLDFRRPVNIAIGDPVVVPPEVLDKHLATRQFLAAEMVKVRPFLGLAVFDPNAIGEAAAEEEAKEPGAS